jgi:hypothetical protein
MSTYLLKEWVQAPTGLVGKKGTLTVVGKTDGGVNWLKDLYPFSGYDTKVPVKVVGEYPNFLVYEVLPHLSSNPMRCGESRPYQISVDKFYLKTGAITITIPA